MYEIPIRHGEVIHAFLDPAGVVVCLDLASVAPAAERLAQHRAAAVATRAPTELERRLAGVPADLPLRGAVVDRRGEIAQLLAWLAPEADRRDWEPSWEPIEAATVAGRFTGGARRVTLGSPRRGPAPPARASTAVSALFGEQ